MISAAKCGVLDRELEEDKSHDSSGSRIRCPLRGWSPRQDDKWFCTCGYEWNTLRREACAQPACTLVGIREEQGKPKLWNSKP